MDHYSQNLLGDSDNIYLSKILFFTLDAQKIAEKLQQYSETNVNTNCLNTIGMYPFISRIETNLGILCLSNWIINLDERFSQFRMPYYSGASHAIVLCNNNFEQEQINDILEVVPQSVPITIITLGDNTIETSTLPQYIRDGLENPNPQVNIKEISDLLQLSEVFYDIGHKIADDILTGEYDTYSPDRTKMAQIRKLYLKKSLSKLRELVHPIGYQLNDDGKVIVPKKNLTYEIDFFRNSTTAHIAKCIECSQKCKHSRKLCIEIEEEGYSNNGYIENLHAIAILYALYENRLENLKGGKKSEDVAYQIQRLNSLFEKNCKMLRLEKAAEKEFQKLAKSKVKKNNN